MQSTTPDVLMEEDGVDEVQTADGRRSRRENALDVDNIAADLTEACGCPRQCNTKLGGDTVLSFRQIVHLLPMGPMRTNKLLELFRLTLLASKKGTDTFNVNSITVCSVAWYRICLKISRATYMRLKAHVKLGIQYIEPNPDGGFRGWRGKIAKGFLEWYVQNNGDRLPDTGRINMPSCICIKDLYKEYCDVYSEEETIDRAQFYAIWEKEFKNVSFPKTPRMSQCKLCMLFKMSLTGQVSIEVRQNVISQRNEHLERQRYERQTYYRRRAEAEANPKEVLSYIVDGMDQKKCDIPHYRGFADPKGVGTYKLKCHVLGIISLGSKRMYTFVDVNQWPHDCNLIISAIMEAFAADAENGQLPHIFYLQLDNCRSENKNRTILAFMALLVKRRLFKEVMVSFLMVGHTHEDIDQRFSLFSDGLKRRDAFTLMDLKMILESSMERQPIVKITDTVFDVRDWIDDCIHPLFLLSGPHVYKFIERDGEVIMKFKHWHADEDWKPLNGEKVHILKVDENGQQMTPEGLPEKVEGEISVDTINALKASIAKTKEVMTFNDYSWWQRFLERPQNVLPRSEMRWELDFLRRYSVAQVPVPVIADPRLGVIQELMNKERFGRDVTNTRPTYRSNRNTNTQRQNTKRPFKVAEGKMVLADWEECPVIGKVSSINGEQLTISAYRVGIGGVYRLIVRPNGQVRTMDIPKDSVELVFDSLTPTQKLPGHVQKELEKVADKHK